MTPGRPIAYSLQFRGRVDRVSARVLGARATAPSQVLATVVDEHGVSGRFEAGDGEEALLVAQVVLDGDGFFDESGTITFGRHLMRFRTLGSGRLLPSPDPHLEHGTAVWEIDGGEGRFAGACGRITSNFFLSDTGELTDNHFGLLFVAREAAAH